MCTCNRSACAASPRRRSSLTLRPSALRRTRRPRHRACRRLAPTAVPPYEGVGGLSAADEPPPRAGGGGVAGAGGSEAPASVGARRPVPVVPHGTNGHRLTAWSSKAASGSAVSHSATSPAPADRDGHPPHGAEGSSSSDDAQAHTASSARPRPTASHARGTDESRTGHCRQQPSTSGYASRNRRKQFSRRSQRRLWMLNFTNDFDINRGVGVLIIII